MIAEITSDIKDILQAVHYRPAVSVILPFEPKMGLKTEIARSLGRAYEKTEKELTENYPDDIAGLVLKKLKKIIDTLNFNTHKKSIAVFVSPVFEKVLYLDIPVEEKVIVDESFEIRDLVYSKKEIHKYLVLMLSGKESRVFLGNTDTFVRIVSNRPENVNAYVNEAPERVANFSDISDRKEAIMDKFLLQVDNGLDFILHAYNLPLFVLGTKRIAGHFNKITKHGKAIVQYIHGNYEEFTSEELKNLLQPHIADWKKVKQKELLNRLSEAEDNHKLATGMKNVWHEAMNKKGRLLVVEKNFMYPAEHGAHPDEIYKLAEPYNKFSYIKDAVDDVIEKVLDNGGDVEFVDPPLLSNYHHIALVQYY